MCLCKEVSDYDDHCNYVPLTSGAHEVTLRVTSRTTVPIRSHQHYSLMIRSLCTSDKIITNSYLRVQIQYAITQL